MHMHMLAVSCLSCLARTSFPHVLVSYSALYYVHLQSISADLSSYSCACFAYAATKIERLRLSLNVLNHDERLPPPTMADSDTTEYTFVCPPPYRVRVQTQPVFCIRVQVPATGFRLIFLDYSHPSSALDEGDILSVPPAVPVRHSTRLFPEPFT